MIGPFDLFIGLVGETIMVFGGVAVCLMIVEPGMEVRAIFGYALLLNVPSAFGFLLWYLRFIFFAQWLGVWS